MTTLREAAQQALEALEDMLGWQSLAPQTIQEAARGRASALRAALVEDALQKFSDVNQELEAALGCDHCNHPLYAAIKCRVCGRVTEPVQEPVWVCPDSAEHRYQKPGHCEDCGKTLVQVAEPIECEPQEAVTEDGWCEWVCPNPTGYLMQCCDCGLIHEVDSRVAKYQPRPSEEFEVVDDPDLQVQLRMKRRDDISPKRKPLTEDEIALIVANCSASAHRHDDFSFARAVERAHGIGDNT